MTTDAARKAGEVARVAYGRLLAILAAAVGDIEAAEEYLADAFARALDVWTGSGVPQNPEAWLLTVARNRWHDRRRSAAHRLVDRLDDAVRAGTLPAAEAFDVEDIPDRRLALLFVCAHPAIDPAVRTPLMLQAVFGFDAERIARAFAIGERAMAQRLVRAKRRIRDARIPFVVPDREGMPARLMPVLEAIYGAYAIDFPLVAGSEPRDSLAEEAHYLAATLATLLPAEPEAWGLAALIALSLARRPARLAAGEFVPLDEQDPSQWDRALIDEGEHALHRARALGRTGRFQLEAAIQSAHCARAVSGVTDWRALCTLHAALVEVAPTLGARVAYAASCGRVDGARAGLHALDAIEDDGVDRFQPAWATRAALLAESGETDAAARAYQRAISLTTDLAARRYLERQCAALPRGRALT